MSLTATQQHFAKFYLAAFLRAPELGGLNYWANEVQSGKSLQHVGGIIFSLPIVTNIYPASLSDLDFVEAIYHNVFGRNSDSEGLNYWSNEIATLRNGFIAQGHDPAFAAFEARGQLTINMINAGLGTPDGTDGKAYIVNRLEVAEYAAERQLAQSKEISVATLLDIFEGVNATAASMFQGLHMVTEATKIDIDSVGINLADIANGAGGFVINGQPVPVGDNSGFSVSSAGDVNGDGLADLIVGEHSGDSQNANGGPIETHIGHSYLVFGKVDTTSVDLAEVAAGNGGFVINGKALSDLSGESVSAAGDVNGDGLADLVVGAPNWNFDSSSFTGHSYVIFGGADGVFTQTDVDQFGTTGDDALSDNGTAQTLVGNTGNDTLSATNASVLYAGAGNDTFMIESAMATALLSSLGAGGNIGQLARIDGGTGLDTLALSGRRLEP